MPLYEYKCKACHHISTTQSNTDKPECPICALTMHRVFGFKVQTPFQDHYNPAIGQYITNMATFKSELTRASDAANESTGIPHNYIPVSLHDIERPSDAGREQWERARSDSGEITSGRKHII